MGVNGSDGGGQHEDVVVRKGERGWVVGDENVSDLTSAMVLADLFAADQSDSNDTTLMEAVDESGATRRPNRATAPAPRMNPTGPHRIPAVSGAAGIADKSVEVDEAQRLAVTVAQLEHALAARVRVEQAIGVLAERHRLRPREAFDLLRKASRAGAHGLPSWRRTWWRAPPTRCSGSRTSCPARRPSPARAAAPCAGRPAGTRPAPSGRH